MMSKEIWKPIVGYEGLYQVSNFGRVKSKNGLKTPRQKKNGYIIVDLYKNNTSKTKHVHVLVAQAFILNPNKFKTVNHKDRNKSNNLVNNLEWVTYSENNIHARRTNLRNGNSNRTRILELKETMNILYGNYYLKKRGYSKHILIGSGKDSSGKLCMVLVSEAMRFKIIPKEEFVEEWRLVQDE